jgi:hypothetical protein
MAHLLEDEEGFGELLFFGVAFCCWMTLATDFCLGADFGIGVDARPLSCAKKSELIFEPKSTIFSTFRFYSKN